MYGSFSFASFSILEEISFRAFSLCFEARPLMALFTLEVTSVNLSMNVTVSPSAGSSSPMFIAQKPSLR